MTLYACSPSSIRAVAVELGISDRTIYRALRRDPRFLERYELASDAHLLAWIDRFDSAENYIGKMKQAWKDWRVLSALYARAREREKKPAIFRFVRDEL